ncbi:MAG: hypothetical protein HON92_03535, partial [Planctomycetaceae bacterium]|nr:hypothetical protein [Planctomycetaceae bacterium]
MNNSRLPVIPACWSAEEIMLDSLCDQFEEELLKLDSPSVSAYIDRATGNIRAKLFRELLFLLLQYEELGQQYIPIKGMLEDFPQFENIIFDVYKQRRPSNATIINKLFDSETDIPTDATVEGDEPSSFNVHEVVRIGKY